MAGRRVGRGGAARRARRRACCSPRSRPPGFLVSQVVWHVSTSSGAHAARAARGALQDLQRRLLMDEHRAAFELAHNWAEAYVECVHGADADVARMLRQALRARRPLVLLDGVDEGGGMRAAIEQHVVDISPHRDTACW